MKDELLKMLKENDYKKGEFTLSSGKSSDHYVNCKPVTLTGRGLTLASMMLLEHVDTKVVAGMTLGADPLVSGVAMACHQQWRPLDALIVRKEPKGHGTTSQIEGNLPPKGSNITILEDVTTTGQSALKAVDVIRKAGYNVDRVVTIVDRKEYDHFTWYDKEVELYSLFTIDELI